MVRVRMLLQERLAQLEEPLISRLQDMLLSGKQLRPALVVLLGETFAAPARPFHKLAAATEMLHTATLLHDDVLDQALLRRGQQTLHSTWSVGAAVLAGDYLLGQATTLVAELDHPALSRCFGDLLCTMCAGEIRHMQTVRGARVDRQEVYLRMEAKTASFFATTMAMGGLLAGAERAQVAAARRFGRQLGLAYQIVDDVLDLAGDEGEMGKPVGNDLRHGVITLPLLCYLETSDIASAVEAVLSGQVDEAQVRVATEAVRGSGALDLALEQARTHVRNGQESLLALPTGEPRQMLWSLADYVVNRDR
jgi:geranylgeranyl pyrophosphate synthase